MIFIDGPHHSNQDDM